jgi:hypothetical protein
MTIPPCILYFGNNRILKNVLRLTTEWMVRPMSTSQCRVRPGKSGPVHDLPESGITRSLTPSKTHLHFYECKRLYGSEQVRAIDIQVFLYSLTTRLANAS